MKKILKILGISILIIVLFRGWIYRLTVNYTKVGERETIKLTDEKLIAEIKDETENRALSLIEIVEISKKITNRKLSFTSKNVSKNPSELIKTGKANCVGYSAMFNSITDYLINREEKAGMLETKHLIGRMDFLGLDLHPFFDSPFFRDHDYNQIKNLETGEIIWIDPSVSDYLKVDRISSRPR